MSKARPAQGFVGLACTPHDPAIALLDETGKVLFAESVERWTQRKRAWNTTPDDLGVVMGLIDQHLPGRDLQIGLSWGWGLTTASRIGVAASRILPHGLIAKTRFADHMRHIRRALWFLRHLNAQSAVAGRSLAYEIDRRADGREVRIRQFRHHDTHAVYACAASPFDRGLCVVMDGFGTMGSASVYEYKGDGPPVRLSGRGGLISLGVFYAALTEWCGFDMHRGEEGKVMGLAAHGTLDEELHQKMSALFQVRDGRIVPAPFLRFIEVDRELGASLGPSPTPEAAADLAHTGQRVFEDAFAAFVKSLMTDGPGAGNQNLILAGGCALNSTFNGIAAEMIGPERLFVPSAPADDGNAIGAGILASGRWPTGSRKVLSPFLGSSLRRTEIDRVADHCSGLRVLRGREAAVARLLELMAEGEVVGCIQGRAEFGPRALGNRSILADPRDPEILDFINHRVKFREGFRPLAPVVLDSEAEKIFTVAPRSPYMSMTHKLTEAAQQKYPGVTHVDGTGRVQTVTAELHPLLHDLLVQYRDRTGSGVLLNTSLNVMGKPIAHTAVDGLGVLLTTGLRAILLEDVLIEKPDRVRTNPDRVRTNPG
jgi:carbamoyltransferase